MTKIEISKKKFFCIFSRKAAIGIGTIFMCFLGVGSIMVSKEQEKGEKSRISPAFRQFFQNTTLICWGFFIAFIAYCATVAFETYDQAKEEFKEGKTRNSDLESFQDLKSTVKNCKTALDSIKTLSETDKNSSIARNASLSKVATDAKLDQVISTLNRVADKLESIDSNNVEFGNKFHKQNEQFVQDSQQEFLFRQQWFQNFETKFFNHMEQMNVFFRKNDKEKKAQSDKNV